MALLFFDLGARSGWVNNVKSQSLTHGKESRYSFVHKVGWAPGPVLTGVENLVNPRTIQPIVNRYTDYRGLFHETTCPVITGEYTS